MLYMYICMYAYMYTFEIFTGRGQGRCAAGGAGKFFQFLYLLKNA